MKFEVRCFRYTALSGEKSRKYHFLVNGEEKFSFVLTEKEVEEFNTSEYLDLTASDWAYIIEQHSWIPSHDTKEFIQFLEDNEGEINNHIAKWHIAQLEREIKSWAGYLAEETDGK